MTRAHRAAPVAALALVAAAAACGERSSPPVAELAQIEQRVDTEHGGSSWGPGHLGETFGPGDAVRTGGRSAARLSLRGGGAVSLKADTLLRFTRGHSARTRISIETGEAETEGTTAAEIELETDVGPALVEPGARVRLVARGDRGTEISVLVGRAVIQREAGEPVPIAAGEQVLVSVGGAQIERTRPDTADAPVANAPPTRPPEALDAPVPDITADVHGGSAEARDPGSDSWRPLTAGKIRLAPATQLRIGKRTSIDLARGDERATIEGPAEVVLGTTTGTLLDARHGTTVLHADDEAITIVVPGGTITARRGTRAEVTVDAGAATTAIQVPRGSVDVAGDTIRAGEHASMDATGRVNVITRTAARADVTIPAGESATVHDPRRSTAVRIRFAEQCGSDGGVVELARDSFRHPEATVSGTDGAVVTLLRSGRKYRVRCRAGGTLEDEPRAEGSLRVSTDSGTAPLPTKPPANVIDADGRHYTVLYQNLLPALTLRWPDAPAGDGFYLHLEGRGATKKLQVRTATHTFSSGDVKEGTYTWWFRAGENESPHTRLRVDFDNAAKAAQIVEPRDGGAWPPLVTVKGVASEGWTASAAGTPLPLDAHQRFEAAVAIPDGEDALSVRLEHASRGIHYYIRRAGAPGSTE